jgi:hypothetical protein
MKTMLLLCAAAMVLTNGIGSAYAADGDGQSTLFTSVAQQQQHSLAVGAQSPPLFTSGGVGVRVWTPMAPSYNAAANGDLAARDIWGQG